MSIKISDLVWKGYTGAGGSDMVIMLALADWANDNGVCFPSMAAIARKARIQVRQAKRVVHSLIDGGWLSVVGNPHGGAPGSTRRYRLNIERMATGVTDDTPTGVVRDTGVAGDTGVIQGMDGCHGRSERGVADDTQTVIEPSENRECGGSRKTSTSRSATGTRRKQVTKTPMPDDFAVSDRVQAWAASKGFDRLDEHLDAFKIKAAARGYAYADWDAAFMAATHCADGWPG